MTCVRAVSSVSTEASARLSLTTAVNAAAEGAAGTVVGAEGRACGGEALAMGRAKSPPPVVVSKRFSSVLCERGRRTRPVLNTPALRSKGGRGVGRQLGDDIVFPGADGTGLDLG